ncbi:YIP1 family protein [Paenibacillus prosopidis]|uniref:Yip1-like protein n=1 Tax=Paenibacillus prosopidis TaxID=630520 RepID=A0A368VXL1_9BACL|nr:YIP1 family protein [Paenibacillus prosopidis]RCW44922.1 Yip1-like protein [Paenibacillus prosopidis]
MSIENHYEPPYKRDPEGLAPWLSVWVRTRETIRQFLDSSNPASNMIVIALLAGIVNALNQASSKGYLDDSSIGALIFVVIAGGMIGGLVSLYFLSFILKWTGSWLGGAGTSAELRVAVTRGINVPVIMVGILWIPELLLFGQELFTTEMPRVDASPILTGLYYFFLGIEVILSVWSIIIALKAIGEAHRFSAWKALWSVIIPGIILVFIICIIMIIASVAT